MTTPTPDAAPGMTHLQQLCEEFPGPYAVRRRPEGYRGLYEVDTPTYPIELNMHNMHEAQHLVIKANAVPMLLTALAAATATVARLEGELAAAHARIARIEAAVLDGVRANHGLPPLPRSTP